MEINSYQTHRVVYDVIDPASFDDLDELFTDDLVDESLVVQFVINNLNGVENMQEFLDEVDSEIIMDSIMASYESKTDNSDFEIEYLEG